MSTEWKFENWIAASWDRLSRGRHILLGVEQWKFRERSRYQEVAIARVPDFGDGLFLDGLVQFLERDEFIYHEHFALPPLLFHENPKRVLIHGGGDGLALREVLRDPRVEEVVMVELDELVIEACREHLPRLHRGSFDNPRAEIRVEDVVDYLSGDPGTFDVQLVDLIDAYEPESFRLYQKVLPLIRKGMAPGGIVSLFGDLENFRVTPVYLSAKQAFSHVALHRATVHSFAGEYAFILGSDDVWFEKVPTPTLRDRASALSGPLRSLVLERFPSAFLLPGYIEEHFKTMEGRNLSQMSFPPGLASWIFPSES